MAAPRKARFTPGELIKHRLFDYRGVVVDVGPVFNLSEEWCEQMARSRPPKEAPWYRVLPDGAMNETYVAERNLEADEQNKPIAHPGVDQFFDGFENGRHLVQRRRH